MKRKLINVRVSDELQQQFSAIHVSAEKDQSDTLRELMRAAIRYYERNGDLYPPFELVPGRRRGESGSVTTSTVVSPVINGHGNHVQASVRSKRKA